MTPVAIHALLGVEPTLTDDLAFQAVKGPVRRVTVATPAIRAARPEDTLDPSNRMHARPEPRDELIAPPPQPLANGQAHSIASSGWRSNQVARLIGEQLTMRTPFCNASAASDASGDRWR